MDNTIVRKTLHNIQTISSKNFKDEMEMRRMFRNYLHDLIISNAKFNVDHFTLFADELHYEEKKIFLSHLVTVEEYEFYIENPHRERVAIKEHEAEMQYHIDRTIDDAFYSYMDSLEEKNGNDHVYGQCY